MFTSIFCQPRVRTILFRYQFHHLFYLDCLKKIVMLIFQLTFVQDSQMILLPKVQTIVTWFLDMTWCVKLLKIIATYANTGKGWLHQTLQLEFWIYNARMIQFFNIPLTAVRWINFYAHLKSIFNGMSSSHLPVAQEINLVQNQFVNGLMIPNGQFIFVNIENYFSYTFSCY